MLLVDFKTILTAARQVALGYQSCIIIGNLSDEMEVAHERITKRDYIRQAFFDLGIEIEFSGKNQHEKGVVIDVDEVKIYTLGLNADALRFGQTVVKAINP